MLHIDIRFDIISLFLLWAAVILTGVTAFAVLFGRPTRYVRAAACLTLLLWIAGAAVPCLT